MEGALVSAAMGALKPVLEKLTSLLGPKYKRFKQVRSEIKFLNKELAAMQAFLLGMSEKEHHNEQDKLWMAEVRELSYDMEDSIDDFKQNVDEGGAKPDGFINKIKHWLDKIKTHSRLGNEFQLIRKQVTEVSQRNARYKIPEAFTNTINAAVDPRVLAIFEHASKLVGIDEPKAEVIRLLTRDVSKQQEPRIVSIVGSGGMGKTTLANQVYQDLKEAFDYQAFISVSQNPVMVNILRTILTKVSEQKYADTEARCIQQITQEIIRFLENKRIFIVIDDIWEVQTLKRIMCAFSKTNCESMIITTTRINDVAVSCRKLFHGYIYNIRPLDEENSRMLFHRRLFNSEKDFPSQLKEVSSEILKKCDGLPLAIIAISGLLASKETTQKQWKEVKDSIGCGLERNDSVKVMIDILSLSYFDLPPHLKTCLLYLSIYPEDSVIKMGGLIRRLIAEGFIHKEGTYTVHEVGQRCLNELVNRSLIQPEGLNRFHRVDRFRVHDTIHYFIKSKSVEENFVTLVGIPNMPIGTENKVRRLSLQYGNPKHFIMPTSLVLSHARSVSVFGKSVDMPSLDKFIHLRVMDFGNCDQLEDRHLEHIGRLFQLRYLNLSWTRISRVPEQIGQLQCLEMLDLRSTCICELSASIVNLAKLVHLLIDVGVKLPDGIARMQALEILKHVRVFVQSFGFMQELGLLSNMRKLALDFKEFESATEDTTELASSLDNLGNQNLHSLTISSGSNFLQGPFSPTRLINLQELYTLVSFIPEVPIWVGSLVNLQNLRLELESVGQKDMLILRCLPALLSLDLVARTDTLKFGAQVGFQCLKSFQYTVLSGAMRLMFEAGSMCKLEKLTMIFRPDETDGTFDFGIGNLPCLTNVKCEVRGYDGRHIDSAMAALERATNTHLNHPTLLFEKSCMCCLI